MIKAIKRSQPPQVADHRQAGICQGQGCPLIPAIRGLNQQFQHLNQRRLQPFTEGKQPVAGKPVQLRNDPEQQFMTGFNDRGKLTHAIIAPE